LGIAFSSGVIAWFNLATNPIILEFVSGYFIAYYFKFITYAVSKVRNGVFLFIIFALLIPMCFGIKVLCFFNDFHMGGMFLPALFIFIFCIKFFDIDRRSTPIFLVFTSKISYSIYLLHMAVIFSTIEFARLLFGNNVFASFSARFNLLFISLFFSWVFGYVFYLYIEEKLSRKIKKYIFRI